MLTRRPRQRTCLRGCLTGWCWPLVSIAFVIRVAAKPTVADIASSLGKTSLCAQSGHGKLRLTVAIIYGRESGRFTVLLGDDGYVLLPTIGRNNRCISY